MSLWRFSDGTTFDGQAVRGGSALAVELRRDLAQMADGHPIAVTVSPPPSEPVSLDLNDDAIVDAWLYPFAVRHRVMFIERPEVVEIEPDHAPSDDPPGTVY